MEGRRPTDLTPLAVASSAALTLILTAVVARDYPLVGHDLRYYIPHLLDSELHLRLNGLAIQWYTPSFGGGLPAFPNPQHLQYSALQLFTFVVNPWAAVLLTTAVYTLIGFHAFCRFLRMRLGARPEAAVLGGVFLVANGFFIEHMIVGHVGYQMFPMVGVLLLALTDPTGRVIVNASVLALTVSVTLYQAGVHVVILWALSIALALPVLFVIDSRTLNVRRMAVITLVGGVLAAAIAAPKVYAVQAFMSHFPREMADSYPIGTLQALAGFGAQLVGAMIIVPLVALAGLNPVVVAAGYSRVTGANVQTGMWEIDTGLSPVLTIGLVLASVKWVTRSPAASVMRLDVSRRVALGVVLVLAWLLIEATLARGLVYPSLRTLPILRSLHVNHRFAAAFIVPLSIVGVACVDRWLAAGRRRKVALGAVAAAILSPAAYMLLPGAVHLRTFDVRPTIELSRAIRAGERLPVEKIADVTDADALQSGASSYRPYEPIFGYGLETFAAETRPGPIGEIRDGRFNMTHPASLVFPELNGVRPFERIAVSERDALEAFASRRQPAWRLPQVQAWLNALALVAAGLSLAVVVGASVRSARHIASRPFAAERA